MRIFIIIYFLVLETLFCSAQNESQVLVEPATKSVDIKTTPSEETILPNSSDEKESFKAVESLPGLLRYLPANTDFFLRTHNIKDFKKNYLERVSNPLNADLRLTQWHTIGYPGAGLLLFDFFPKDLLGSYTALREDMLLGRANGDWFFLFNLPQVDKNNTYETTIRQQVFSQHPRAVKPIDTEMGRLDNILVAATSRSMLGALLTRLAFPGSSSLNTSLHSAAKKISEQNDSYAFWASLPKFQLSGKGYWSDFGIRNNIKVRVTETEGSLYSILDDSKKLESFSFIPPKPLTSMAVRFNSAVKFHELLFRVDRPESFLLLPVARFVNSIEKGSKIDLKRKLFSQLGQEWNFSSFANSGGQTSWVLIVETLDQRKASTTIADIVKRLKTKTKTTPKTGVKINSFLYFNKSMHYTFFEDRLFLTNSFALLTDCVKAKNTNNNFAESELMVEAKKRLTTNGALWGFYHSLAGMMHMSAQLEKIPLHYVSQNSWRLPESTTSKIVSSSNFSVNDAYTSNSVIGCARIQKQTDALNIDWYSFSGSGPIENHFAAFLNSHLEEKMDQRINVTTDNLDRVAAAIDKYISANGVAPSFRNRNGAMEMYPTGQLGIDVELLIDPLSKRREQLIYFADEYGWILASRGPDFEQNLKLPDHFQPSRNEGVNPRFPILGANEIVYQSKRGVISKGDIIRWGRLKNPR